MAHAVPAQRMLLPVERLCRQHRSSCSLVGGFRVALGPNAGACTFFGGYRAQNDFQSGCCSGCNAEIGFVVKNRVRCLMAGHLSVLRGMKNFGGSAILGARVPFRSIHDSQANSFQIEDCVGSSSENSVGYENDYVLSLRDEDIVVIEEDKSDIKESDHSLISKGVLKAGLYLVGTPIGNLEDITLRALRVLKSASMILAEDTRHSSRLLRHYEIKTPTMSYHKFNEIARRDMVLERLRRGEVVALISDAGMPGISDPGSDIVRACVEVNVDVFPIPGPSAVITALVASGLSTDEFTFVAREMTKLHEEFWRGSLEEAQREFMSRSPRGEMTFIVEGLPKGFRDQPMAEDELISRLQNLIDAGKSPSEATKQVVLETSARRNVVYPLALGISQKRKS
ncbi:hypothetical protein AXG93_3102s1590 [Marchantia polymorpha subsp. ruderalis]|uniref:Tetrapyrrole methylase domain-containing protein n=1 Tax=Marchantia polymorpha subsp. ruderalis TaxID=1480154 RepID=A0A176WA89_MARPO|nr:hypothetical protein AXG93_3102s1590 [Marchantia polymorpha subsp. ruderalis]